MTPPRPSASKSARTLSSRSGEGRREPRRVRIAAEVCFREGPLELFLCRKNTKEHESVVAADVDARDIHKALLAAGAKVGSPVKFVPKYEPAKGSKILVSVEFTKDKKTITVPARQWVRDAKTRKELSHRLGVRRQPVLSRSGRQGQAAPLCGQRRRCHLRLEFRVGHARFADSEHADSTPNCNSRRSPIAFRRSAQR